MASYEQVKDWVSRISYKPGWTFRVEDSPVFQTQIYFEHATLDADGERPEVRVASVMAVPPFLADQEEFLRWLWRVLADREMHELLEWLRFGGERVYAAHGEGTSYSRPDHYLLGSR